FLLGECEEHPLLPVIRHCANEFVMDWRTLWFRYGDTQEGLAEFRGVLTEFLARMRRLGSDVLLGNRTQLHRRSMDCWVRRFARQGIPELVKRPRARPSFARPPHRMHAMNSSGPCSLSRRHARVRRCCSKFCRRAPVSRRSVAKATES